MKTVKVRIAVAVDRHGSWSAAAAQDMPESGAVEFVTDDVDKGSALYWVAAELAVPEVQEVAGEVSDA